MKQTGHLTVTGREREKREHTSMYTWVTPFAINSVVLGLQTKTVVSKLHLISRKI